MSRLPSTGPSLQRYLRQQARTAQRQQQSSAFARSGTSVSAEDVVTVDGELDVTGAFVVDGSGTVNGPLAVHGTATFDGNTTIGGNAAITGTLSLPAGIIDNAALTSPVSPSAWHADSGSTVFAVSTTHTDRATTTVTVPAGYTQALIFAVGQASAVNSTGIVDTLYVGVVVNGVGTPGWAATQDVAPAGLGGAACAAGKLLTGLTGGGTFTVSTRIYSAYAGWAGNAANSCNIDASVLFLR